jgi:hypothetical protein
MRNFSKLALLLAALMAVLGAGVVSAQDAAGCLTCGTRQR